MGRSGDLIRKNKTQNRSYTFTAAQLAARDNALKEAVLKQRAKELEEEAKRQALKQVGDLITGDSEEDFYNTLQYLFAVSVRVLIERFGWRPVDSGCNNGEDHRYKVVRFAQALTDELNALKRTGDIKSYAKDTAEKYGVGFVAEDYEKE